MNYIEPPWFKALIILGYGHNTRLEELSYENLHLNFIQELEKENITYKGSPWTGFLFIFI